MGKRVCPWWLGYWLASPVRRWWQDPGSILSPYVREGQVVLEPGPGMGFFTLDIARRVGSTGHVVAVELQSRMLEVLKRRARKAGLQERIDARLASAETMGIGGLGNIIDFTLAFAVVHEFPDAGHFFSEVSAVSKKDAVLLLAEPKGHVKESHFKSELDAAFQAGFQLTGRPDIHGSHAAVLNRL